MDTDKPSLTIHIEYFAILREQRGLAHETIATVDPDARALYRRLREAHAFSLSMDHLRIAVNDDFCDWSRPLSNGDRVVFIPPMAGG